MKASLLNRFTLLLLYLCLVAGVAFLVFLPWLLPQMLALSGFAGAEGWRYIVALSCWMLGSAGGLFILLVLIRMMKSLAGDPFLLANAMRLRRLGMIALCMAGLTVIALALYFQPMLLFVAMAELLCALFSLVLCGVFQKAVEYREENALTI